MKSKNLKIERESFFSSGLFLISLLSFLVPGGEGGRKERRKMSCSERRMCVGWGGNYEKGNGKKNLFLSLLSNSQFLLHLSLSFFLRFPFFTPNSEAGGGASRGSNGKRKNESHVYSIKNLLASIFRSPSF